MSDKEKMELAATGAAKIEGAHRRAVDDFLNPEEPLANVVGVASGVKWRGGEPTGEPAVLVLVSHKIGKEELPKEDLVPVKVGEVKTDVLEIGFPIAQQLRQAPPMRPGHVPRPRQFARPAVEGDGALMPMLEEEEYVALAEALMLARRVRPAEGGYSVGHYQITAGTIATCVYDILPGGTTGSPPAQGIGTPPHCYILSNNHVLANTNAAQSGDPILQPGPYDGGTDPTDRIAALSRWVPITLEPPTPRSLHRNVVDAAIASIARSTGSGMPAAGAARRTSAWARSSRRRGGRPTTPPAGSPPSTQPSTSATAGVESLGSSTKSSRPTSRPAATPAPSS